MSTQVKIEKMLQKTAVVLAAGGEKRIAKQHAAGKMTARERIASLLDENSFVELDRFVKHRCTDFGQSQRRCPAKESQPAMVLFPAVWSTFLPRILQSKAVP